MRLLILIIEFEHWRRDPSLPTRSLRLHTSSANTLTFTFLVPDRTRPPLSPPFVPTRACVRI